MRGPTLRKFACSLAVFVVSCLAAADARAQGVTLYRDRDLRGPSQTFYDDVPDLKYTQFGSRRASSIAVSPGCDAVLYEHPYYRGRSTTFRDDDNNLKNTDVGEDTVSSMRVNCRGHLPAGAGTGARTGSGRITEARAKAGGTGSPASAERSSIATATEKAPARSSTATSPTSTARGSDHGWQARSTCRPAVSSPFTSSPGFRGRRTEFHERDNNLKNTAVGEDTVSSLRIRCK